MRLMKSVEVFCKKYNDINISLKVQFFKPLVPYEKIPRKSTNNNKKVKWNDPTYQLHTSLKSTALIEPRFPMEKPRFPLRTRARRFPHTKMMRS